MLAHKRQLDRFAYAARNQIEGRTGHAVQLDVLRRDICRAVHAEGNHFSLEVAAKLADVVIVGVEYSHATRMQGFDQLILGPGNISQGPEKLKVHGGYTGDDGYIM